MFLFLKTILNAPALPAFPFRPSFFGGNFAVHLCPRISQMPSFLARVRRKTCSNWPENGQENSSPTLWAGSLKKRSPCKLLVYRGFCAVFLQRAIGFRYAGALRASNRRLIPAAGGLPSVRTSGPIVQKGRPFRTGPSAQRAIGFEPTTSSLGKGSQRSLKRCLVDSYGCRFPPGTNLVPRGYPRRKGLYERILATLPHIWPSYRVNVYLILLPPANVFPEV